MTPRRAQQGLKVSKSGIKASMKGKEAVVPQPQEGILSESCIILHPVMFRKGHQCPFTNTSVHTNALTQ